MYTSTIENYLKQLYLLEQRVSGKLVPTGKLASSLGVTPGTATLMVKTLADSGLVDYESRAGVRLSEKGRKLALHVVRRHRLIEQFLVQVLGLDWSEVHEEAEVLEHAISDKVLNRIDTMLGHPTFDPHGDPIPSPSGQLAKRQLRSLADCETGQRVEVARIENQDPQFLRFADERGLTPGRELVVTGRDDMADAVTIAPAGREAMVVGTAAAKRIYVTMADDEDTP